jgi:uncharacterized membrane protein YbhN (UPF0104 family)
MSVGQLHKSSGGIHARSLRGREYPVAGVTVGAVALGRLARRLVEARRPSPRTERLLLTVASIAMVVGAVFALREGAFSIRDLRWAPLLLAALVGVPLTAMTNAGEYWLSARAAGLTLRPLEALRTTVLATAANLLPLPGGPLVRIQALRTGGIGGRVSTQVTAAAGASWVAVAGLAAALGGAITGAPRGAVIPLTVLGVLAGIAGVLLLRTSVAADRDWRLVAGQLVVVELGSVLISAARLYLLLLAIGAPATGSGALVLALAGVLATAVGIVPAGLGVREGLSALLAVAVALPAATGFAVSVLDRVVGLVVAAPLALVLTAIGSDRNVGS